MTLMPKFYLHNKSERFHYYTYHDRFPNSGFPNCEKETYQRLGLKMSFVFFNRAARQRWGGTIETQSEFVFDWISSPPSDSAQCNTVKECIEMRACMLLCPFCACDAIWSPLVVLFVECQFLTVRDRGEAISLNLQFKLGPLQPDYKSTFHALRSSLQWMVDISNHSAVNPSVR